MRIPRIDRASTDPNRLPCITVQVIGTACAMYRLRCKSGVLNKCYSACNLEFFEGNFCLSVKGWESSTRVSLRAASKESTPWSAFSKNRCKCTAGNGTAGCVTGLLLYNTLKRDSRLHNRTAGYTTGIRLRNRQCWASVRNIYTEIPCFGMSGSNDMAVLNQVCFQTLFVVRHSSQQARRKLAKLKQTAKHVLWFSEQLGLTATEVVFENTASQSLTVGLNGKTSSTPNPPNSKEKDTYTAASIC